jgi:hypothetical protein
MSIDSKTQWKKLERENILA